MRVQIESIEHRYQRDSAAVIAVPDHVFEPGTITGITGPSGSGKSTLLYLLALMLTPSSGIIRWGNQDVQSLTDAERAKLRAKHVGFVFQDAILDLSRNAIDNVLEAAWLAGIPKEAAEPSARELLERFGIGEKANYRPGEVSGGQAQRVALCRALVKNPEIIFADEPTGNLDSESATVVWDALADAAKNGATVIVASHDSSRVEKLPKLLRLKP